MTAAIGSRWSLALAALLLGAALLTAGCDGGGDAEPAEAATGDRAAAASPRGPGDDGGIEEAGGAPLTGLALADGDGEADGDDDGEGADDALERPVVAVKVDNAPAARPQAGLEDAEIVLVEPVEGGLTRFVALYHAEQPERVGPVRSAREADADLLPAFAPVFAHSGAAPPVLRQLQHTGMLVREEGQPSDAWARDTSRRAPHNLFAIPAELPSGLTGVEPARRPWLIAESGPAQRGEGTDRVALRYSAAAEVSWAWDGDLSAWARSQDGEPHVAESGAAITAANVVVAEVDVADGDRTDAAGNPVVDLAAEGEGPAFVLVDGHAIEARWRRDAGGQFSWVTPEGEPIALVPGRTWVELVPRSGGAVDTRPPEVG